MNLSPEDIYLYARYAGFSPDQAVTMTAIALAESGGNPDAHNPSGEDSWGLWQVNLAAHPQFAGLDPTDPLVNAQLAFEVSGGGSDIGRWTVTHADNGAAYLQYRDEAEAAARAAGEVGVGQWDPPDNYYSPKVGAGPAGEGLPYGGFDDGASDHSGALETFIDAALSQDGDPYIFGAEAATDDADPDSFDCSELVQWAAAQAGVEIPDGSYNQYLDLRAEGTEMSVDEALRTPGALVFYFSEEPVPGGGRPSQAHVAISLGDGRLIEARGRKYGVGVFDAEGRTFSHAAYIGELGTELSPDDVVTGDLPYLQDSDGDYLLDSFELVIGTDPFAGDTDRDGFLDSDEMVDYRSDPLDFVDNPLRAAPGTGPLYRPPLTTEARGSSPMAARTSPDPLRPSRTEMPPQPPPPPPRDTEPEPEPQPQPEQPTPAPPPATDEPTDPDTADGTASTGTPAEDDQTAAPGQDDDLPGPADDPADDAFDNPAGDPFDDPAGDPAGDDLLGAVDDPYDDPADSFSSDPLFGDSPDPDVGAGDHPFDDDYTG